jgi:hypothetical protein
MNKKPALFFINAKFSNKNLIKLEKFLTQNLTDIVMLAESTRIYDQSMLERGYKFNSLRDFPGKRRINIFSKIPISIKEANPSKVKRIIPRLENKLLSFKIGRFQVLVVHIPTHKDEFLQAMEFVVNSFQNESIDLAVGDFNFGYSSESPKGGLDFNKSQHFLKKLEEFEVVDTQNGKGNYSYVSNRNGSHFRLDHIFSKHKISYKYVGNEQDNPWDGYDHKGILFKLNLDGEI